MTSHKNNIQLQKLNDKINQLKQQQEKIHHQLGEKIIKLLISKNAFEVDFNVLYGAIIEVTQKINNASDEEIKNWKMIAADTINFRKSASSFLQDSSNKKENNLKN